MEKDKKPNIKDFEIKIKIKDERVLKAIASIRYLGVSMRGFRISSSSKFDVDIQDHFWIQPPVYLFAGKWIKLIRILDESVWRELKKRIFAAYKVENNKYYEQRLKTDNKEAPPKTQAKKTIELPEIDAEDIEF